MTTFAVVLRDKDAIGEQGIAFYFMAFGIPSIIMAPLSGWVVDRFSTRAVIGPALAIMGLSSFSLTLPWPIWWTPVALLITATAGTVVGPASQAAMLTVTAPEDIPRSTGLMQSFSSAGMLFAPVAASFLITGFGYSWPFVVDAVSFWMLGVVIYLTGVNRKSVAHEKGEKLSALEGMRFAFRDPLLRAIIVLLAVLVLSVGVFNVGDVFMVQNELHATVTEYGFIGMTLSVGSILGSLIASAIKLDRKYHTWAMLLGVLLIIVGLTVITFAWHWIVVLVMSFVLGLGNSALNSYAQGLVFGKAPQEMLGRIGAAVGAVFSAASVGSLIIAGPLLQNLHVRGAYAVSAAAGILVFIIFTPAVLRANRKEHAEN